jgi:hypothetical protein
MLNTKNIELIYANDAAFLFNKSVSQAKKKLDILLAKIKSHGGFQSLKYGKTNDLPVISSIQNNRFSRLLDIFLIDRNKLSDKDFEILKKHFNDLNVLFSDLITYHRRNRPLTTANYPYPLFKFVIDFFGLSNVKVNQIVTIEAADLPKNKTRDTIFNQYLRSQYSYAFAANVFVQSVNFTVK